MLIKRSTLKSYVFPYLSLGQFVRFDSLAVRSEGRKESGGELRAAFNPERSINDAVYRALRGRRDLSSSRGIVVEVIPVQEGGAGM